MKADIRDATTVSALRPLDVAAYLRTSGWSARETNSKWSVWTKGMGYEVSIPLERTLRDFPIRMGEVLRTLEAVENRGQLEIFNDVTTISSDIIRIRAAEQDSADGTISLEEGKSLVDKAAEVMVAAACATISPRPVYRSRRPTEVTDYLHDLRLGQTEVGSFVVKIVSRIPPLLTVSGTPEQASTTQEPFSRRVSNTLFEGLNAARGAAQMAMSIQNFDAFSSAVPEGVSANLCSAIAAMGKGLSESATLSFELSYARTRPTNLPHPERISFQRDYMPVLEEAGRIFREKSPFEDFEVRGTVEKLNRVEGAARGTVVVPAEVEDKIRRVSVELEGADYDVAIASHRDRMPLICEGTLIKQGLSYALQSPRNVRLLADNDEA